MDIALFISHGHCYCPDFAEVKVHVMLMVVRGDPAHPHAAGLLTSEDPHRVIVLGTQRGDQRSVGNMRFCGALHWFPWILRVLWEFNKMLPDLRPRESMSLCFCGY
jgi:hypothetical protein